MDGKTVRRRGDHGPMWTVGKPGGVLRAGVGLGSGFEGVPHPAVRALLAMAFDFA